MLNTRFLSSRVPSSLALTNPATVGVTWHWPQVATFACADVWYDLSCGSIVWHRVQNATLSE